MRTSATPNRLALALVFVTWNPVAPVLHAQAGSGATEEPAALVVYVVRHAEKQTLEGENDPPLTPEGEARARALVAALPLDRIVAVYSSPFARTRATVAPAAAAAGATVVDVDGHDMAGLAARIREHGHGAVLVAGHTDTVPQLIAELGVAEPVVIESGEYGDLFIVYLEPQGARLERARFGL